jgi:hypothetical protein
MGQAAGANVTGMRPMNQVPKPDSIQIIGIARREALG